MFLALPGVAIAARDANVWEASIDRQTKERYIPVDLWAVVEWDGKKEFKMPPVDGTYRRRTSTIASRARATGNTQDRRAE